MSCLGIVREDARSYGEEPFPQGLSAAQVDTSLRHAAGNLVRAERSALLWFMEMSRRKLYAELGYPTMQVYATEVLGFSANMVYCFERLAGELDRLPRLRRAVARGELGWTKARVLVRVASAQNERTWIARAKRSSWRELQHEVEKARRHAAAERGAGSGQTELMAQSGSRPRIAAATRGGAPAAAAVEPGSPEGSSAPEADTPTAGALTADAPVSVHFRLTPLQLARYEALLEGLHKSRVVAASATREEILLSALDALLSGGAPGDENTIGGQADRTVSADDPGDGNTSPTADPGNCRQSRTRVQRSTPYNIVIYRCDACRNAAVQTNRGMKRLSPSEFETAECDAIIDEQGKKRRRSIPLTTRKEVLRRDDHSCQARGCKRTRFLDVHHIKPRSKGGTNRIENLVTLCSNCHGLWHRNGWGIGALKKNGRPAD